jgi:hypothetical protein
VVNGSEKGSGMKIALVLGLIAFSLAQMPTARSQEKMSIYGVQPLKSLQSVIGTGWIIYLDGEIDSAADARFAEFIAKNDIGPYSTTIVFNSPGGNPLTAMKIGRLIRERGFSVGVGRKSSYDTTGEHDNGICFSACSLAYLGGRFRWLSSGSRYGVHRFWFSKPIENAVDITQILSAAISTYVHEMGISPQFNSVFVSAGKDEMMEPSRVQLEAMRVINNGFEPTKWTIESREGVIYLKGERDTVYGINKFILFCGNGNLLLHMIMDPQGRQHEVMRMRSHRLVVNNTNYSRLQPIDRKITNGWFNVTYSLSPPQAKSIEISETVGVIIQNSDSAPIFLGFNAMEIGNERQKVRSFLKSCRL